MTSATGTKTRTATAQDLLVPKPTASPDHGLLTGNSTGNGQQHLPPLPADLDESLLRLKMPHARRTAPELLAEAKQQGWDHAEFLRRVLGEEVMGRDEATRASRVRAARFAPNAKSFASWKPELSSIDTDVQQALIALGWARRKETLVLAGPSGTGKSHLAGALSRHAIECDMRVSWTTLETLGDLLTQAKIDGTVTRTIAKICRADMVVIDDIGVLPVEPAQAEAFYRIIDCAYERRSILLTSNTHPSKAHMFERTCVRRRRNLTGSAIEARGVPAIPAGVPRVRCGGRAIPISRGIRSLRACARRRRSRG
jgi:DNA replication protein DnaC